jgi:hypothetical protein
MYFGIDDIKNKCPKVYALLPSILKMPTDNYYVVKYKTNYSDGSIIVNSISTIKGISLSIYKGLQKEEEVAYFKTPFDSKNFILFQVLSFLSANEKMELIKMYEGFRYEDREISRLSSENTLKKYDDIFNSESFRASISKYVIGGKKENIVNECCMISDILNSYYQKKNTALYFQKLKKIIGLIQDNNGNIIPDDFRATIKFMLIGENSEAGASNKLLEAKKELRSGISIANIYDNTGWFYSKNDNSWKKQINDAESRLTDVALEVDSQNDQKNYYYVSNNKSCDVLYSDDVFSILNNGKVGELKNNLPFLPDVLYHPELYKQYPFLAYIKCLYASTEDSEYSFYYSDEEKMIVIFSSNEYHKHTVLLHEVQHAIQGKENWARGGNDFIAKLGMENSQALRDYISSINYVETAFNNLDDTQIFTIKELLDIKEFSSRKEIARLMMNEILIGKRTYSDFNNVFTLSEIEGIFNAAQKCLEIIKMGDLYASRLKAQGYSGQKVNKNGRSFWTGEIGLMIFKAYEFLLGEVEARYTQKTGLSNQLTDYFLPNSAETYNEEDLIIYTDEYNIKIASKSSFGAAIEKFDGTYTIHLKPTLTGVPIAHEIGHIFYDEFQNYPELISGFMKEISASVEDFEEHFVSCFLNYIKRQKEKFPILSNEIKDEVSSNFVDSFLSCVFYGVEKNIFDAELGEKHLQFVKLILKD